MRGRWPVLGFVVALVVAATACRPSVAPTEPPPTSIVVVGSWTGSELTAFKDVLAAFTAESGYEVELVETRDLRGVIAARRSRGQQLDVAGVDGPEHLAELARSGSLQPLATAIDVASYKAAVAPTFVELGSVDDRLVGAFIKSTLKGLIWYDPRVFRRGTPATWEDLQRLGAMAATGTTRQWCVGLASGESSGWPGTDWIENILIRQGGPDAYDRWVAGGLPWASREVRRAFETYGQVVADDAVFGGAQGAIATDFTVAAEPLFTDPPGCLFMSQGSFMIPFLEGPTRRAGEAFDFFPFPDIDPAHEGAVVGAGDLVALLSTTPGARALMAYLLSVEGQTAWVRTGGALSPDARVQAYPNDVVKRAAGMLVSARRFRFDASDQMPAQMNASFLQAVLDFSADQRRLPELLAGLDQVRRDAYGL